MDALVVSGHAFTRFKGRKKWRHGVQVVDDGFMVSCGGAGAGNGLVGNLRQCFFAQMTANPVAIVWALPNGYTPVLQRAIEPFLPGEVERVALENDIAHICHEDAVEMVMLFLEIVEVQEVAQRIVGNVVESTWSLKGDRCDRMRVYAVKVACGFRDEENAFSLISGPFQ